MDFWVILGLRRLALHLTSCLEASYRFFLGGGNFFFLKTSPHLLQLFWRMLQCCFAVKLQKCYVDDQTPPLHQHEGEIDNDWILISGWTRIFEYAEIQSENILKREKKEWEVSERRGEERRGEEGRCMNIWMNEWPYHCLVLLLSGIVGRPWRRVRVGENLGGQRNMLERFVCCLLWVTFANNNFHFLFHYSGLQHTKTVSPSREIYWLLKCGTIF